MSGHTQGEMDFGPGESGPYHGERAPERDPRGRRPKPRHAWRITRKGTDGTPEYWTNQTNQGGQIRQYPFGAWTTDADDAKHFPTWNEANTWRKRYHIDPDAITEDTGTSH